MQEFVQGIRMKSLRFGTRQIIVITKLFVFLFSINVSNTRGTLQKTGFGNTIMAYSWYDFPLLLFQHHSNIVDCFDAKLIYYPASLINVCGWNSPLNGKTLFSWSCRCLIVNYSQKIEVFIFAKLRNFPLLWKKTFEFHKESPLQDRTFSSIMA